MSRPVRLFSSLTAYLLGTAMVFAASPFAILSPNLDPMSFISPFQTKIGESCWDASAQQGLDEFNPADFTLKYEPWVWLKRDREAQRVSAPPYIVCHDIVAVDVVAMRKAQDRYLYPDGSMIEPAVVLAPEPFNQRPDLPAGYDWELNSSGEVSARANGTLEAPYVEKINPLLRFGAVEHDENHVVRVENGEAVLRKISDAPDIPKADGWVNSSTLGAIDPDENHTVQIGSLGQFSIASKGTEIEGQIPPQEVELPGSRFDGPLQDMYEREALLKAKAAAARGIETAAIFAKEHPRTVQVVLTAGLVATVASSGITLITARGLAKLATAPLGPVVTFVTTRLGGGIFVYAALNPIGTVPQWTKAAADWSTEQADEAEADLKDQQAEIAATEANTPYDPQLPEDTTLTKQADGSYMLPAEHQPYEKV